MVRKGVIIGSVIAAVVVAAGLATLIWWLVTRGDEPRFETIPLEGEGFDNVLHSAAFTRIPEEGDMFWWFYPTIAASVSRQDASSRPLVLWLDGVTGLPPSLEANFGMLGPLDFNLNRRSNSWIEECNLLLVDAPLGAGFSTVVNPNGAAINPEQTAEHLLLTLESFYDHHAEFENTPLYIFGQGYGGQLALSLALALQNSEHVSANLKGIVLGNPIISPALALTQLGFYLEELGYVDGPGRAEIENYTNNINQQVNQQQLENAFDNFLGLDDFVNQNAGAVAINLRHIIEKLTRTTSRDVFGQSKYLRDVVSKNVDIDRFMNEVVGSALGISNAAFDSHRDEILQAFRETFMVSASSKVEEVLNNTNARVIIYNGNLDAISNIPGQLEWVHNLQWAGQNEFLNNTRQPLIVNRVLEGYFQETDRLTFYWMNAAGLMVPLDSPVAMKRVLQRILFE